MRSLNIASLLIVSLALGACGDNKQHKTALQKTITPSRKGARAAGRGGCPKFDELFERLNARKDGFLLHTYDYDLVSDAKAEDVDAAALKKVVQFRALRGAGAPKEATSTELAELTQVAPLNTLLDVTVQKACESVTFGSGDTFRVLTGDEHTLSLINDTTREGREYVVGAGDLLIKQSLPQQVNECSGTKQFQRSEAVTLRLAWGESAALVKLAPTYAKYLGVADAPAPETPAPRVGLRVRPPAKPISRAAPTMPLFVYEKLTRDAVAKAATLTCKP